MNMKKKICTFTFAISSLLLLPSCLSEQTVGTVEQGPEQAHIDLSTTKSVSFADIVAPGANPVHELNHIISKGNVVIDFYATWCGPCKIMSPLVDELATEFPDITFIKVDIDKFKEISAGFELAGQQVEIAAVPAFYFIKDGAIVNTFHGGMKKELFIERLKAQFGL